ncbi:MAG: hypothetical protein MUC38_10760 [Cyclobacteriaceae bacterium]|jgi:hypothetical protein|nr:hypothetical protein [Cyclobacteriaceae bacterium]
MKQQAFVHRWAVWLVVAACVGCAGDEDARDRSGFDFFPVDQPRFFVYAVSQTRYSNSQPTVSNYQWRWELTPEPFNGSARSFSIRTYTRATPADAWVEGARLSGEQNGQELIVFEENQPFVKITYPVGESLSWDGNRYNTLGGNERCGEPARPCDVYRISGLDQPLSINGFSFAQTLTVEQSDDEDNIVGNDVRTEVFARGVGLISRAVNQIIYCTTPACLGRQQIESGVVSQQQLIEYGMVE